MNNPFIHNIVLHKIRKEGKDSYDIDKPVKLEFQLQ